MENNKEVYELTNPQKSIWYMEEYFKGTPINNICGNLTINEKVDFEKFAKAINLFIKSNDNFQIRLFIDDGKPKQYFADFNEYNFELIDIKTKEDVQNLENEMVDIPFQTIEMPLFKFKLFRYPNGHGGFVINIHHIISDAGTLALVCSNVCKIYSNLKNEIEPELDFPSYKEYILTEKEYLSSEKFKKDEKYWNEKFEEIPDVASIPSSNGNVTSYSSNSKREVCVLSSNMVNNIRKLCIKENISVYNFFMAIFALYIGRVTNLNEFVVGTPILNRTNFKEKNICGMFISTVPLKICIKDNITFLKFVSKIATDSLSMLRHQRYPYQYLLENIRNRNGSVPSLYDSLISYQVTKIVDKSVEVPYLIHWKEANNISCGLNIHIHDNNDDGNLTLCYDYLIDKYNANDIEDIHKRIIHIINQLLDNININIGNIEIVTPKEKNQILNKFNNMERKYPTDKCIIELFKEQVEANASKIALVFNDTKITYGELDKLSDLLAENLLKFNVKNEDKIAIFLDKSIEMIVCILAILKVNATFVPIDITYPKDRICYILEDSQAKLILTTKKLNKSYFSNFEVIFLDGLKAEDVDFKYKKVPPSTLAYIMYTSGSTGKPKGVMIEQKSIIRLVKNPNYIKFGKHERILQTGSIVFDACTFEIWSALLNGFELYILSKEDLLNPMFLGDYLQKNQITILWITAPLFNQLSEINPNMFKEVHYLLTGGDVLSPKHINRVIDENPNLKIINGYGPTENTTFSCCFNIDKKYNSNIPIGYPISGSTAYVVSQNGMLQPIGVHGELWVGGDGVGRGYLNRKDLTAEKFIKNPFGDGMIYKTGDLVKWLPDGSIDFIGRIDNQVKIRGFRVELSEINNTILNYNNIVKNSVTIVEELAGTKTICSYIIPKEEFKIEDLKKYLTKILPNYMIPSYFIIMNEFPINVNGKIDKGKLPKPKAIAKNRTIIKPNTELEKEIYSAIKQLNIVEPISIEDNFFNDMALDSLNAMQLCAKLYDYNITIQDISDYPTIKLLAEKIDKKTNISLFENELPVIDVKNKITDFDLSNVLLTGTTGFLGMHLLRELLINDNVQKVFCLVRPKSNVGYKERFWNSVNYYFNDSLKKLIDQKVKLISGDFTNETLKLSEEKYNELIKVVTTVIHCGANVKHYGNFRKFSESNVIGTKNMIRFCELSHAKLAHISTVSVGGFSNLDNIMYLTENNFNIGQQFCNHVYMITKYLAEYFVLDSINCNKIDGEIFRIGNIMPSLSDNKFQHNVKDNAFLSRLQTIINLQAMPENYEYLHLDLSPVDLCAEAIVKILSLNKKQTIYHIYNNNQITVKEFLKLAGVKCDVVSNAEMMKLVKDLHNPWSVHILNDLRRGNFIETPTTNELTVSILNSDNFYWNKPNKKYINNLIDLFEI